MITYKARVIIVTVIVRIFIHSGERVLFFRNLKAQVVLNKHAKLLVEDYIVYDHLFLLTGDGSVSSSGNRGRLNNLLLHTGQLFGGFHSDFLSHRKQTIVKLLALIKAKRHQSLADGHTCPSRASISCKAGQRNGRMVVGQTVLNLL